MDHNNFYASVTLSWPSLGCRTTSTVRAVWWDIEVKLAEGRLCSVQHDGACSKAGLAKAQLQLTLLWPLHLWSPASGR